MSDPENLNQSIPIDVLTEDTLDITILSDSIEAEELFVKKLSLTLTDSRTKFLEAWNKLVEFERSNNRLSVGSDITDPASVIFSVRDMSRKLKRLKQ